MRNHGMEWGDPILRPISPDFEKVHICLQPFQQSHLLFWQTEAATKVEAAPRFPGVNMLWMMLVFVLNHPILGSAIMIHLPFKATDLSPPAARSCKKWPPSHPPEQPWSLAQWTNLPRPKDDHCRSEAPCYWFPWCVAFHHIYIGGPGRWSECMARWCFYQSPPTVAASQHHIQ